MDNLAEIRVIPIIDIFNRYISGKLIQRGRAYWSRCPWHGSDTSPSLKIYPHQNSWWCYGCSVGGSQIDMVVHALGLTVGEAIKRIRDDYRLESRTPEREIRRQKTARNIQEQFEKDFKRVFAGMAQLSRLIYQLSRDIRVISRYPNIFQHQLMIDGAIDGMMSQDQAEQISAWRQAKKVWPWI